MNPNNKTVELTQEGFDALQIEFNELKNEKRPKLVERLSFASSQGDLSENSDYTNAREELEFLDGRISELEEVLKSAMVVEGEKAGSNQVGVGTSVTVKVNGKEFMYNIVGEWEADPAEKKISHTSPLGQSLIGKKEGEKVEVEAPAGKIVYEIVAIK